MGPAIEAMHAFARSEGLRLTGKHHDTYLVGPSPDRARAADGRAAPPRTSTAPVRAQAAARHASAKAEGPAGGEAALAGGLARYPLWTLHGLALYIDTRHDTPSDKPSHCSEIQHHRISRHRPRERSGAGRTQQQADDWVYRNRQQRHQLDATVPPGSARASAGRVRRKPRGRRVLGRHCQGPRTGPPTGKRALRG